jgi:hypothetical protein
MGPYIKITSPKSGSYLEDRVVTLTGKAINVAWISLNDRPIFIDEKGNWSEKLIAPPGYSIMTVKARDRFGRESEKQIELMVKQST